MHNKQQLIAAFHEVGLGEGDLVLVHSSLRKLGPVEGGADTVIDALLECVGKGGTVAVPTHTFKIVNSGQPVFHETLSPSNVGILTNIFRKRKEAVRGLHPTHSVAAIGPNAAEFVKISETDSTPCSRQSPYGKLADWNGKVLIIGEGLNCCTFFHGCEEWAEMPQAVADYTLQYYSVTESGRIIPFSMHKHVLNTWDQYPRLEPELIETGALNIGNIGDCPLRLLDAKKAADWLIPQLQRDCSIVMPDN